MLPRSEIEQYGGKAAILNYIAAHLPKMPIPRYVVKPAGQSLDPVLAEFNSMKKPVIVRSSSPHEYADFEGIFESIKNVRDQRSLTEAIQQVEQSAPSERARKYAAQHSLPIDERIHLLIQEQSSSHLTGTMMRHPNNPELVFIQYYSGEGRMRRSHHTHIYYDRSEKRKMVSVAEDTPLENKTITYLVEQLKAIESLAEIGDGKVLLVEFGLDPFMVYQARPFKKIETADFQLPTPSGESVLHTDLAFGITPPDGIMYPVLRSVGQQYLELAIQGAEEKFMRENRTPGVFHYGDLEIDWASNMWNLYRLNQEDLETRNLFAQMMADHHQTFEEAIGQPYCFLTSSAKREDYDVDLTIPHMRALVLGNAEEFLTHGLMRLIKQAEVTFARVGLFATNLYKETKTKEHQIRIISNGKEAVAMRE